MARKKNRDIFADDTQNTDATQATTPPVEKESRRQRKKRQANMTLEEMTAETDRQLGIDKKLEPNLSRNSTPDVIPEGEAKSDRYKTVIEADPYGGRKVTRTKEEGSTGTAITNAINNTSVTTGSALYNKALADNPNMTFQEIQELTDKLAKADKEKENVEAEADAVIDEKVDEVVSDIEGEGDGAVEGDGDMEQGGAGAPTPNAQSQTLMNMGGGGDGTQGPPDYESETDINKVKKDIAEANSLAAGRDAYVPQAVVERLGVQDYFPTIGQEIQKGTWTGSVLGSQTVYAGGGMVLPMGLYDARKRALNEAAKEKQAAIDKLLELPNTADQFNTRYQDYGYEFINSELERYGSTKAMAADPEFRRKLAEFKNIGKDIAYVDKWADGKFKELADGKYIPEEILQTLYDFKSGILEDFDGIMAGDKRASEMVNALRSFESGTAQIDGLIKDGLFDENRLDQAPISLNTGAINADPEGWGKFQDDMLKVINKDGSIDNDTYVTGLMKFFDTSKAEGIIDGLLTDRNVDKRTKESMLKYLLSQAPKKIVYDYQSMGNDSRERAADAMENSRFYAGLAERKRERETYYQHLNRQMNTPDAEGKLIKERIAELKKIKDPKQRTAALIRLGNKYNLGTPVYDKYTKAVTFVRAPSKQMKSRSYPAKSTQSVLIEVYDPKKKKYVERTMTLNEVTSINTKNMKVGNMPKYRFSNKGGSITKGDIEALRNSSEKIMYNIESLGAVNTFYDPKTKSMRTLTESNWGEYDPKNSSHVERLNGRLQYYDPKSKTYKNSKFETFDVADFQSPNGQTSLDAFFGDVGEEIKGQLSQDYSSSSYFGGGY